jgi:hypothetical protein
LIIVLTDCSLAKIENEMKKFIPPFLTIVVVIMIAVCLIFLSRFTYVYPPIKEYEFPCTVDSLGKKMLDLVKDDRKYNFVIDDIIGDEKTGYNYYAELSINVKGKNYKYILKYFGQINYWHNNRTSTIELTGAYNETDRFGGFKMEDNRMINVVRIFNKEFIEKLN